LPADENAKKSILQYFVEQILYAKYVPNHKFILIEITHDIRGELSYIIFNSLYGRRVNDALSRVFAILLGEDYGEDIGIMVSDNGFVLSLQAEVEEDSITENSLKDC